MQSIKCAIKYITKKIISAVLHVFWIFPVQKNKILFINDHSYTFSDNLKYFALYISDADKNNHKYDLNFSLKDYEGIFNDSIKPVRFMSLSHFYHAITSGIVITNNSGISYLPIRKSQLIINTWHGGGPYKVTGLRNINNYWYKKDLDYNAHKTNYILSSCKVFSEEEAPGMGFSGNQVINSGMPRMDYFFNQEYMRTIKNNIFTLFNLDGDARLVLYAPTFRGQFESYDNVIDNNELGIDYRAVISALETKFGGAWHFAVRLHPRLKDVEFKDESIINMSQYPDAEEVLMATDVLITDYSSVMWDFSFSKRPIFLYASDINDYEVKRGFYIPPEEWPYSIASSNEDLIENITLYDHERYLSRLDEHYLNSGSYEHGDACAKLKELIDEHLTSDK